MSYDPMDVFGGAVGTLLKRFGFAISVMVAGVATGFLPLVASSVCERGMIYSGFRTHLPASGGWLVLDVLTLVAGFVFLVKWDKGGYRLWLLLVALISLALRVVGGGSGLLPHLAGWITWVVLLAGAATGSWFIRQWQMNRWALHLARVNAANAMAQAERESRPSQFEFTVPPASAPVEVRRPGMKPE